MHDSDHAIQTTDGISGFRKEAAVHHPVQVIFPLSEVLIRRLIWQTLKG